MAEHKGYSARAIGSNRGMINTEYVCIGTPEETLLETYFVMLSKFNFDRAKEQCDKEKEAKGGMSGTNWCEFMYLLCRFALIESSYHNMAFTGKSFLKKEPLQSTYGILKTEFKKVQEVYSQGRGGTDVTWERKLADLIKSIMEFITARIEMVTIYQTIDMPGDGSLGDSSIYINGQCKAIQEKFKDRFRHSYVKPIQQSFWSEVEVLHHLSDAQHHIILWEFLPSIINIQASHNKLSSWCGLVPPNLPPQPDTMPRLPSIRARPSLPPAHSNSSVPIIYKWLCTYHNSLLSKFTLYFYNTLQETGAFTSLKGLSSSKFDPDYIQRFQHLIRTTQISCICLVFDASTVKDFCGPKYQVPGTPSAPLTGLNSYPIMLSIPTDYDFLSHKPNIVSMIMSKGSTSPVTGISVQQDNKVGAIYYLAQIDVHVTLVAIHNMPSSMKSEKDSPIISLLTDLIYNLRCHHVLHYLTKK